MIADELAAIVSGNSGKNSFFVRNLLKEHLQLYILNFVYSSPVYNQLIFTGGTCLRRFYNLPRLSEDLDFDFENYFNPQKFSVDVGNYFVKQLQYREMQTKLSGRENILFLKFPNDLFVRCDFSKNLSLKFGEENRLLAAQNFTFIAKGYDLPTLFANKITAFLKREFKKGSEQKESFKGRDVFDLSWFVSQSMKQNWKLKANWERLSVLMGVEDKKKLISLVTKKLDRIEEEALKEDLSPFIADENFVNGFAKDFRKLIVPYLLEII